MTEPKVVRWDYCLYDDGLSKSEEGVFVEYDDYARLAARVQELDELAERRAQAMDRRERVVKRQDAEIAQLAAENQRLREALETRASYARSRYIVRAPR